MRLAIHALLLVTPCLLLLTGCGESDSATGDKNESKTHKNTNSSDNSAAKQKSRNPAANLDTPDGAMRAVIAGFRNNRVEALWEFLPARYQADVSALIRQTVDTIDPEVWDIIVRAMKKLVGVVKQKKTYVINNPNMMTRLNDAQKQEFWSQTIAFAELFLQSDLSDREKAMTLDVREFLSTTGNDLLQQIRVMAESTPGQLQLFNSIEQMNITLIENDGTTAVVQVEGPDIETHKNELVRIDGKWVPRKFSENWPKMIGNLRNQIANQKPIDAASKEQLLAKIEDIDQILNEFAKVRSQREFDQLLLSAVGRFMRIPVAEPAPENSKPQSVTVLVEAELTTDAEDKLIAIIKSATDDPKLCDLELFVDDGTTRITVSPVSDIQAFAKALTFGKVTSVDSEKLIVVIKLTQE